MTAAAEPTFLDTNVLVYASMDRSPFHAAALAMITDLEANHVPLWISRQVIREFLATLIRPSIALTTTDIVRAARVLELRYHIAEESPLVTAQLLTLLELQPTRA